MKQHSRDWQRDLFKVPAPREFKQFYTFIFDYLKEDKKILLIDEASLIWTTLYKGRWGLLDKWIQFLQQENKKSISRDTWQQLYEFIEQNPSTIVNHDPTSSWPVAIDEFVDWVKEHK